VCTIGVIDVVVTGNELRELEAFQQGLDHTEYEERKQSCNKENETVRTQILAFEKELEQAELTLEDIRGRIEQLELVREAKETEVRERSPSYK
jgi:hypothetical protein